MEVEMSGESPAAMGSELVSRRPWGTWEELVLGGAVLRHGAADWAPVAAELRLRFTYSFTPQECEAKYEDVQERFSGFDAWFEELRTQRVEELRRELEQSEDSIGSLQLKLETLKAERESDESADYNSGRTDSPFPAENAGDDLSSKEPSNDRSSAGSFIEETRSTWSPEPQIADSISAQDINVEDSKDSTWNMFSNSGDAVVVPGNLRKKRGARKRRFHSDAKEGSTGVSNSVSSVVVNREESKGFSSQNTDPSKQGPNSKNSGQHAVGHHQDLGGILDALTKHKSVSFFGRRLESQKKARYRKMIRRHVDFQIIKSRISDGSISSAREILRDLLLLSNNALVFYPKQSQEYKSAIILRQLVSKGLPEDRSPSKRSIVVPIEDIKMVKPEASEPCDHKATGSELKSVRATITKKAGNCKVLATGIAPTSPPKKRGVGRPAKNRNHQNQKESPVKGRKVRR